MVQLPNAETRPAIDEQPPFIGPNLAADAALAKEVTQYVMQEFWYPQMLLQQRFWNAWQKIDRSWRGRFLAADLDPSAVTKKTMNSVRPSDVDGTSAKGQSVMPFKQIHAVTDIAEQMSWQDDFPFRVEVPPSTIESDFYRPSENSAKAAQALLVENATEIDMRSEYRKNFGGGFAKYGVSWVFTPFEKKLADYEVSYRLDANDPALAQQQFAVLQQMHPQTQFKMEQTPEGMTVSTVERRIESFRTNFLHIPTEAVFIDPLLPCEPISAQPCPILRQHVNNADIEGNQYDPEKNPFGYVNTKEAIAETKGQYALSAEDEGPLLQKLHTRYNISDQTGGGQREERIKQRWTAFPLLRIHNGKLDTGDGVECPHCAGTGKMAAQMDDLGNEVAPESPCKTCTGTGKVHPPLKRYTAVFYGTMRNGATCIRLQEMPRGRNGEEMRIPLIYAADLIEDDSCAYPMSKAEIALIPIQQLTLAECQYQDAKEQTINRGFKVKEDSPAWNIQDLNKAGIKIPFEGSPEEVQRIEQSTYDETTTLLPYMQGKEQEIQHIFGANDTLLGMIQQGRRSALEIGSATEASKNPLVLMVDRYNKRMPGGWAEQALWNIEQFGDRDYIRRKTGLEFFGKVRIFTAVGQEFVKKMAAEQNLRWVLQASPTIPALQPVMPQICNQLFQMMGLTGIQVPDGNMGVAVREGMQIVSAILGTGIMSAPMPDDPHEIYLEVFNGAMKDPYWQDNAPQNLPLLAQRIAQQQQLLFQQQMQEMQAQMAMQEAENGGGRGQQSKGPQKTPGDHGEQQQQAQG